MDKELCKQVADGILNNNDALAEEALNNIVNEHIKKELYTKTKMFEKQLRTKILNK